MGPYIVLLFLILAGLGAWNIGGMLSKNNISKKEPPKPSNLEQKIKKLCTENPRRSSYTT